MIGIIVLIFLGIGSNVITTLLVANEFNAGIMPEWKIKNKYSWFWYKNNFPSDIIGSRMESLIGIPFFVRIKVYIATYDDLHPKNGHVIKVISFFGIRHTWWE